MSAQPPVEGKKESNGIEEVLVAGTVPANVFLKQIGPDEHALVRSTKPTYSNITTIKAKGPLVFLDFAFVDAKFYHGSDSSEATETTKTLQFQDFELDPHSSVVMDIESALRLQKKLDEVLTKHMETLSTEIRDSLNAKAN